MGLIAAARRAGTHEAPNTSARISITATVSVSTYDGLTPNSIVCIRRDAASAPANPSA